MKRTHDGSLVATPTGGAFHGKSFSAPHNRLEADVKAFERSTLSHYTARLRQAVSCKPNAKDENEATSTTSTTTTTAAAVATTTPSPETTAPPATTSAGAAASTQSDADFASAMMRALHARFQRVAKIGQGSFGEVYIVYDTTARTYLTMKRVQLLRGPGRRVVGLCNTSSRELNLLRVLRHPNVVALYDFHVVPDGTLVLLMPLVAHDLVSLVRLWRRGGPRGEPSAGRMPLPTIKCIFRQLLRGVAYLHQQRVIHRDLKPSNVMLDAGGVVKIIDFGWARFCPARWRGAMTGPPCPICYRPPEVLLGGEHATQYDASVDIWCCACILFEMLSGGKMLISARGEAEAVDAIIDWIGSPDPKSARYYGDPRRRSVTFRPNRPNRLAQRCELMQMDSSSVEVLGEMLRMEPNKRASAAALLQHAWFTTAPLPCEPHEISLPNHNSYRWLESRKPK